MNSFFGAPDALHPMEIPVTLDDYRFSFWAFGGYAEQRFL